jgi:hypothetical protein
MCCQFVVSGRDGAKVLNLIEEALDEVALAVEFGWNRALNFARPHGRDMSPSASCSHEVDDKAGIVAAVGDEIAVGGQASDEFGNRCVIGSLPSANDDAQRQTALVDNRVDLGTQSPTRTANGVIRAPFLPPAAC